MHCNLILISVRYYAFLSCQVDRKDLTHLKVYAIDVDEADEVHHFVNRIGILLMIPRPCSSVIICLRSWLQIANKEACAAR